MRLIDSEPQVEYFEGLARSLANARCFGAADAIQGAAEKLRNAPTIDAEPVRHGRWMKLAYDQAWTKCSECGCNWEWEMVENCNMIFCPDCGAKMDEEVQHAEERSDS